MLPNHLLSFFFFFLKKKKALIVCEWLINTVLLIYKHYLDDCNKALLDVPINTNYIGLGVSVGL